MFQVMINIKTIFNVIRKYLNKKNKKAKKTQWWRNSDMIAMQYTIVALAALRNGVQDEIPKWWPHHNAIVDGSFNGRKFLGRNQQNLKICL